MDIRSLTRQDFDAVVALDRDITGYSRRDFFERRLGAALRAPARHLQLAAVDGGTVFGFVLARVAGGEFGRPAPAVVIEAISVARDHRHLGAGRQLLDGLLERMRRRDIHELVTQASWRDHELLRFLDGAGFELASRNVLERKAEASYYDEDDDLEREPHLIRTMTAADIDAVVSIDSRTSGSDREEYLRRKLDEALSESAVQASLAAIDDGHVVGFLMARVDMGDFGRVSPAAVIDTLGVDPRFARKGYGKALLEQLLKNLSALGVETVQTEVDRSSFDLLRWFYAMGFGPSQRLVFTRRT